MMGRAKRPPVGEFASRQRTRHRMDHGDFEQFARIERRQNGGKARRQHAFARTRRAVHQHVMATGGSDFQCALGAFLPFDVAQVRLGRALRAHGRGGAGEHLCAAKMIGELDERARRDNVDLR